MEAVLHRIDPTAEVQGRQGSNDAKEGDQQADGDKDVRKPVEPAVTVSEIYEEVLGAGRILENIRRRSEEHTSELQSLMSISYAVFCLKKKTTIHHEHQHSNQVN